ncbi:MAG: hypothetical protein JW819_14245 [Candidatus Krumholzibacteriota bacterium]|nr:hypothetical protein [Candidatus Krumholzibacteriota bacterium]
MKAGITALAAMAVLLSAAGASGLELVVNGDFESAFAPAWEQSTSGTAVWIERGTDYDPDPDHEARVRKGSGNGRGKLSQTFNVPGTDLRFSAKLLASATASSTDIWAAGALMLSYQDLAGNVLGRTAIGATTHGCPWSDSDTFHLLGTSTGAWQDWSFLLDDELANLPGVDPSQVRRLEVALVVEATDC